MNKPTDQQCQDLRCRESHEYAAHAKGNDKEQGGDCQQAKIGRNPHPLRFTDMLYRLQIADPALHQYGKRDRKADAVNAMKKIDNEIESKMGKYTQGMPGLF